MRSYDVSLGVLEGYGASGPASLGYSPFAYVRVSRGARGAPLIGVIAHELGHVLGLGHQDEVLRPDEHAAVAGVRQRAAAAT